MLGSSFLLYHPISTGRDLAGPKVPPQSHPDRSTTSAWLPATSFGAEETVSTRERTRGFSGLGGEDFGVERSQGGEDQGGGAAAEQYSRGAAVLGHLGGWKESWSFHQAGDVPCGRPSGGPPGAA